MSVEEVQLARAFLKYRIQLQRFKAAKKALLEHWSQLREPDGSMPCGCFRRDEFGNYTWCDEGGPLLDERLAAGRAKGVAMNRCHSLARKLEVAS